MKLQKHYQIEDTLTHLFNDAKSDHLKMIKGVAKGVFRPLVPTDFKDAYLSISKEQGEDLRQLIKDKNLRNIVEFGTSFGISTLYLAQGVVDTGGSIITTELIESKALKAIENFKQAGVNELIEVRIGNALETLKNFTDPIDLLLLDGWKDLYFPLFELLEPCFHLNTLIYVDNADMRDTQAFLEIVGQNNNYQFQSKYGGKAVLISSRN